MQSCWRGLPPIKRECIALRSFEKVVNLDVLIELLVTQSNLYSQQNGRHFITNPEEIKAFLGTNYVKAVNQLPNISMCWDCDHFIGNMVLKTFLQGVDTRRSCRIFTLQIILNKIKPTKATRYALSLITWTNHSKKATRMSLSKALISIWPSSRDILQWDNIWKWNQLNEVLNGGLDMRAQMIICMNLIYI